MGHSQRNISVSETGLGKYQNEIVIGQHRLLASEPESLGGDDSGPTPIELLEAALGACTTITLRMYADRKKWPLEQVSVDVKYKRGQLEECGNGETGSSNKPMDIFTKKIHLTGPLDAEQRERLLYIAEKCPVHKILGKKACLRSELGE